MSRSIWGMSDANVKRFQGICKNCMTPEEHKELEQLQIAAVAKRVMQGGR
jgi:hypothetical protein